MSTTFAFWRTKRNLDPATVYAKLSAGARKVRGLDPIDPAAIEAGLIAAFPDWEVDGRSFAAGSQTTIRNQDRAVEASYTPQSVICTCYGLGPDEWNAIIDVMLAAHLPLYDPQTNERFSC